MTFDYKELHFNFLHFTFYNTWQYSPPHPLGPVFTSFKLSSMVDQLKVNQEKKDKYKFLAPVCPRYLSELILAGLDKQV